MLSKVIPTDQNQDQHIKIENTRSKVVSADKEKTRILANQKKVSDQKCDTQIKRNQYIKSLINIFNTRSKDYKIDQQTNMLTDYIVQLNLS